MHSQILKQQAHLNMNLAVYRGIVLSLLSLPKLYKAQPYTFPSLSILKIPSYRATVTPPAPTHPPVLQQQFPKQQFSNFERMGTAGLAIVWVFNVYLIGMTLLGWLVDPG
jgi:hypothetical protein